MQETSGDMQFTYASNKENPTTKATRKTNEGSHRFSWTWDNAVNVEEDQRLSSLSFARVWETSIAERSTFPSERFGSNNV